MTVGVNRESVMYLFFFLTNYIALLFQVLNCLFLKFNARIKNLWAW